MSTGRSATFAGAADHRELTLISNHQGTRKVKIFKVVTAVMLAGSAGGGATAQGGPHRRSARAQRQGMEGREVAEPPWSAACMTDHGPSECGEPMWIYGTPETIA